MTQPWIDFWNGAVGRRAWLERLLGIVLAGDRECRVDAWHVQLACFAQQPGCVGDPIPADGAACMVERLHRGARARICRGAQHYAVGGCRIRTTPGS